jgi:hypothetical protein
MAQLDSFDHLITCFAVGGKNCTTHTSASAFTTGATRSYKRHWLWTSNKRRP